MLNERRFSKEVVWDSPAAGTKKIWRASGNCKVTAVRAIRTGGTGAVVNAQVGTDDLLAADLSLTSTAWLGGSSGLVADQAVRKMVAGDTLQAEVVSVAGTPTSITFQIDLLWDVEVH